MPTYRITEPHPSVTSNNYVYSGRGGAGNISRAPKDVTPGATATGPASRVKLSPLPTNGYFTTGRGGFGNVHREKERAMFSFDEELAQQERLRENAAQVYHIGRGGAGNLIDEMHPRVARQNSASSNLSADSGKDSVRRSVEGAWNRVSRQFSRNA